MVGLKSQNKGGEDIAARAVSEGAAC
jgi:hypothetical protein